MAFSLKPDMLKTAKKAEDIQKKTKADLKSSAGKAGVKFVAAKNVKIGGKTVNLFIVTDTPKAFETLLSKSYPEAARASGTCDVTKDKKAGTFQVTIKTAQGPLPPPVIAKLVKTAVLSDKSIVASFEKAPITAPKSRPDLNEVDQPKDQGVPDWAKKEYRAKHGRGVPDWAKKEYVDNAGRTVTASMTPDGKIGSIYFEGDGRIRTTHRSGPTRSEHGDKKTLQFNIDRKLARAQFDKENPSSTDPKDYPRWLSKLLVNSKVDNLPGWAKLVDSPKTAHDLTKAPVSEDAQLFEIFTSISGEVEGWHPSRGAAVKYETDKQTISVLHAAITHINKLHPLSSNKDDKDPIIVKRRRVITQFYKTQRAKPSQTVLQDLLKDGVIAPRVQKLKLVNPTITDLDKDATIHDRIDKIFAILQSNTLKDDTTIKEQLLKLKQTKALRNKAFYDFVKSRLPKSKIVEAMREPKDV